MPADSNSSAGSSPPEDRFHKFLDRVLIFGAALVTGVAVALVIGVFSWVYSLSAPSSDAPSHRPAPQRPAEAARPEPVAADPAAVPPAAVVSRPAPAAPPARAARRPPPQSSQAPPNPPPVPQALPERHSDAAINRGVARGLSELANDPDKLRRLGVAPGAIPPQ